MGFRHRVELWEETTELYRFLLALSSPRKQQGREETSRSSVVSDRALACRAERKRTIYISSLVEVSFAKEPYKRDDILHKRPMILRSLLLVATPYSVTSHTWMSHVTHIHTRTRCWVPNAAQSPDESCRTCERVMSPTWKSHLALMNEPYYVQGHVMTRISIILGTQRVSRITSRNDSYHTHEWVMSQIRKAHQIVGKCLLENLRCVAACCSMLQCVAVWCSVLQYIAVCCSELHSRRVAVSCSILQCVELCCSVLQCVAVCCSVLQCVAFKMCCNMLQYAAVCCSVLQCAAVCCSVLQ